MAINKITAPLAASPSVFAQPVLNQLQALVIDVNHGARCDNQNILKGALFCIGGFLFLADSDTPITGTFLTTSQSIKFVVSGDLAIPSYSEEEITWNGSYQGYYDAEGNYHYEGLTKYGESSTSAISNFGTSYEAGSSVTLERQGQYNITMAGSGINISKGHIYVKLFKNGIEYISEHDLMNSEPCIMNNVLIQSGDVFTIYAKYSGTISAVTASAKIDPIL